MIVYLDRAVELANLDDLHLQLMGALELEPELTVDGSAVLQIDGAGLQLLASLFETGRKDGKELTLVSPSQALCQAAAVCGLSEILGVA